MRAFCAVRCDRPRDVIALGRGRGACCDRPCGLISGCGNGDSLSLYIYVYILRANGNCSQTNGWNT
eukprot:10794038-Lingulodinium_polyedra.AAC.1